MQVAHTHPVVQVLQRVHKLGHVGPRQARGHGPLRLCARLFVHTGKVADQVQQSATWAQLHGHVQVILVLRTRGAAERCPCLPCQRTPTLKV